LIAADGKQRLTDAADTETMLRIIQSIPSPKAEPFKAWMARVGRERLEELENPALTIDRLRQLYKRRGYTDEWIDKRLQGIIVRDELTLEWRERGADEGREFAILTDILHRGTFELSTDAHKAIKSLRKRDNLRDSMTSLELALTMLSEAAATTIHQARDSQGFTELQQDTHEAGEVGGAEGHRGARSPASRERRELQVAHSSRSAGPTLWRCGTASAGRDDAQAGGRSNRRRGSRIDTYESICAELGVC
jgi:DNA-damage-inducible protein D